MEDLNTNLCIGGPLDGKMMNAVGADVGRGEISVMGGPEVAVVTYERTAYEGEKLRFLFWKAQGLSLDDALKALFDRYGDTTITRMEPPPS